MSELKKADAVSRRAFVSGAARTLLGVGVSAPLLSAAAGASPIMGNSRVVSGNAAAAKSCIYIYLSGGMSHLDTFDTKPGAETQGPVESIKTSADGVQISEFFPNLAKQMHNVCVINSMNSTQGAHAQGQYIMHTSYELRGTVRHPDLGAWSAFHLGKLNKSLPANVKIGGNSSGLGGGFLESKFAALPIGDPETGLQHSKLPQGIDQARFSDRMARLKRMNASFTRKYNTKQARAYASMYDEAVKLMKSEDLKTFDLTQEQQATRDSYGEGSLGQGCLLARRMVEAGVRFIEVSDGGWDTHDDNFTRVAEKSEKLDKALAALLADLSSKGMLETTLVVVATEFGRTPTIQQERRNGRNHYPQAFSCLLAGGGIKGGLKYGSTDDEGREVEDDLVTVTDFNATIAKAMGMPLEKKTMSPEKRPFTIADDGEPVDELFA